RFRKPLCGCNPMRYRSPASDRARASPYSLVSEGGVGGGPPPRGWSRYGVCRQLKRRSYESDFFSIDPPRCRKRPRIPPGPVLRLQFVERRPHGGRALGLGAAVHIVDTAASHHPVLTGPHGGESGVRADIPLSRPCAATA